MAAFGCDIHQDQVRAWIALNRVRAASERGEIAASEYERLRELFFEFPEHSFPADFADPELAGKSLLFSPEHYRTIRRDWAGSRPRQESQIAYTTHFRRNYREIVRFADEKLR